MQRPQIRGQRHWDEYLIERVGKPESRHGKQYAAVDMRRPAECAQRDERQDASGQKQEAEEKVDRKQRPRNGLGNLLQERTPVKHRRQEKMVGTHRRREGCGNGERYRRGEFGSQGCASLAGSACIL